MEKLKERITENGIDYILVGDYYIPDLKLPEENRPIGCYGRLHREYLKQEHLARYSFLRSCRKISDTSWLVYFSGCTGQKAST